MICILVSSKLSGTIQSAMLAKDMVEYDHIYIVDSLAATCPNRFLADHAVRRANEGADARTILTELEALKGRVRIVAVVDTLEYLCKGGRLSRTAAVIGEMAKVKPIVTVRDGEVAVAGKCLGRNKAASTMLKMIGEQEIDPAFPVYTLYSYGTENCEQFEERLQAAGYQAKERVQIGATVGTHIGPGAYGAAFVEK